MRKVLNTVTSILISLVLASIVWAGATAADNPQVTAWYQGQVPIQVVNQPAYTVIVTRMESSVQVRLAAPQSFWDSLSASDFAATVDLSQVAVGQNVNVPVNLQVQKRGVKLVSYKPATVAVRLEQYMEVTVPLRANIIDSPPLGYITKDPVLNPATVKISGPAPLVSRVTYAGVDIWLRGSSETIDRVITPVAMDSEDDPVTDVSILPAQVNVKVELAQRANFKPSVPVRVQLSGEVAPLYWVSNIIVKPASVTLVGLPSVLEEVPGYVETEPIDVTGATDHISTRIALKLPAGVSVVPEDAESTASQTVQVDIEVLPVTGGRTLRVPIQMQGLAPQYKATLSPDTVDIYLSGPLGQLQDLKAEDVEVTVNLVDLAAGTHRLTPKVIVPKDLEIKGMVPEAVEVQIVNPEPTPTVTALADSDLALVG